MGRPRMVLEPTGNPETKRCTKCKQAKPLSAYRANEAAPDKKQCWCTDCYRDWFVTHRYGLSAECYRAMETDQKGLCAICHELPGKKGLSVDHNHGTGKIRALLCAGCNTALGSIKDSPIILMRMFAYLQAHSS